MSDTPDLSKIVSLIMENPHLISEISALAKGGASSDRSEDIQSPEDSSGKKEESEPPTSGDGSRVGRGERRVKLLTAMKPYLKDERKRSLDTVLTVAEMLDMIRSK